jgi:hypothetical protein
VAAFALLVITFCFSVKLSEWNFLFLRHCEEGKSPTKQSRRLPFSVKEQRDCRGDKEALPRSDKKGM